jgi:tetrahydromethanopterin S-methyltransferase subunit G
MPDENEWSSYSRLVLAELERLNACSNEIEKRLNEIEKQLAANQVKIGFQATMYGILGGAIPVFITIALWLFENAK